MRLASYDNGFGRVEGHSLIHMGDDLLTFLQTGKTSPGPVLRLEDVRLRAPIPRPGKILSVGPTYVGEGGNPALPLSSPEELVVFGMFSNSVIGPDDIIHVPRVTSQPDYEAELGLVIGVPVNNVEADEAQRAILGYTCINDISARDIQYRDGMTGLTRGKAIDTFLPTGPWIVTADELGDVSDLCVRCYLNNDLVQEFSTGQMLFTPGEIVSSLSRTISLEPGDIITTGTGPGAGFTRTPPVWLEDADIVMVEIEGIGRLRNLVRRVS